MIAFFDASALIHLIEGKELFASKVRKELAAVAKRHADLGSAVSRLTWLECRAGAMKASGHGRLAAFDAFFTRPDLVWVELTRELWNWRRPSGPSMACARRMPCKRAAVCSWRPITYS